MGSNLCLTFSIFNKEEMGSSLRMIFSIFNKWSNIDLIQFCHNFGRTIKAKESQRRGAESHGGYNDKRYHQSLQ